MLYTDARVFFNGLTLLYAFLANRHYLLQFSILYIMKEIILYVFRDQLYIPSTPSFFLYATYIVDRSKRE